MVGAGVAPSREEIGEVEAFLRLKEIPRLGDRGIRELVERHGTGAVALRALGVQGELLGGAPTARRAEEWAHRGLEVLPQTSPRYPPRLLELEDPPPLLFLKGREELLARPAVAVVGARRATEVGRRMAGALAGLLARAGVTVISGLAMGIDAAAHRGALEAGGDTLAVLGAGVDVHYPRVHASLSREIARGGLLVSEFLPDEPPLPHHFPRRNRIIAALARAVVVVEAGERSGALITVDHALDLGRHVLAVPGSVESPQARGTNALLRDGASVLPYPRAVLEELAEVVRAAAGWRKEEGGAGEDHGLAALPAVPAGLEPLWAALAPEPRSLDQVAGLARLSPGDALSGLAALELGGWALPCPGMRFRRA